MLMCCCYEQGCLRIPAGLGALAFVGAEGRRGGGGGQALLQQILHCSRQRVTHMRLHRPRANLPITPLARLLPGSRENKASHGGLDTERLSSFPCWRDHGWSLPWDVCAGPWCSGQHCPVPCRVATMALAGVIVPQLCPEGYSLFLAGAGPPCSVSCLPAAGSHTSGQLPGARASATAAPGV